MSPRRLHIIEGNRQRLDGGSMFGNAPRALWQRWCPPDERNRIDLACRALLVEDGDRRILFETGIGAYLEPQLADRYGVHEPEHRLLSNLADRGLGPEDIDIIVLSHLHFDHAGGLLKPWQKDGAPALCFPRATFLVGSAAWERARAPHARDRVSFIPELPALLERSGRLEIVDGDRSATLGDDYRFSYSEGHTPGMMMTRIGSAAGVWVVADLAPGVPWLHLPITMGYDRFPERLIDEKTEILGAIHDEGALLCLTHDAETALCRLARDDRGRYQAVDRMAATPDAGVALAVSEPRG